MDFSVFLQCTCLCAVTVLEWLGTADGKGQCWLRCHASNAWWHPLQIKISRLHVTPDTLRPYGTQSSMKFKRSHPCNDTSPVLLISYIVEWNFPLKHFELESTC